MNIQWTFCEHSVNIQWTFSEPSVNIQWTFSPAAVRGRKWAHWHTTFSVVACITTPFNIFDSPLIFPFCSILCSQAARIWRHQRGIPRGRGDGRVAKVKLHIKVGTTVVNWMFPKVDWIFPKVDWMFPKVDWMFSKGFLSALELRGFGIVMFGP